MGKLHYVINSKYDFWLKIIAKVSKVDLKLSTKVLKFTFADSDIELSKTLQLDVTNNGNADVKVKWALK